MEWYKHKTASHDDPDISDALDIFGDAGYTIFFITLEIYGREFNRLDEKGNLVITKKFLKRKLRKSWTKVEKVFNFYQKRQRFVYKDLGDFVSLQVPKFIDLASNWTKRQQTLPTESPTESPTCPPTAIEEEGEVEEEKKERGGGTSVRVPYEKLKDLWNSHPNFPKILNLSKTRKVKIHQRWEEHPNFEEWDGLFNRIATSDFLTGNNDRGWRADFDWITANDTNWLKVAEGKYNVAERPKEIIDCRGVEDFIMVKKEVTINGRKFIKNVKQEMPEAQSGEN